MPDFMKKKKESTPVPVSSQRQQQQQQSPSASTSQTTKVAASPTEASTAAVDASEDIFAQVDKLEEDLGISHKKKAKEVCDDSAITLSKVSPGSCYLVPSSTNTRQHDSRCPRVN